MNSIKHLSLPLVFFIITATAYSQMGGGMGPGGQHGHNFDDFDGWKNHQVEHNVVFPQIAIGDRFSMTLIITNLGGPTRMGWLDNAEDSTLTTTIRFIAADGEPLAVRINDVTASQFPLLLAPAGVSYLEVLAPAGVELNRGWALVEFEDDDQNDWGFMDGHALARGERAMVSAYYSIFNAA